MANDDYEEANRLAKDFYSRDVQLMSSAIQRALKRQRNELAALAETLWDDKRKSADFNKACLTIGAMIRDGDPVDTKLFPGISLIESIQK